MKIRKGDKVKVIAGKDKGKEGKVLQAFPDLGRVVVEGANVTYKHLKVRKKGDQGQKIEYSSPMNVTNVQLICPKCAKPTRLGMLELSEEGKTRKVRSCKKCKEAIE
ncbi:MAG: 50S ribosomal protein L24 [Patescibacteria group bacterium]|nr:50S ribosomal protein L24 [Patescibacteria group bacterium]